MAKFEDYETGIGMTPFEVLDRLVTLENARESTEKEAKELAVELKAVKERADTYDEQSRYLVKAKRDGRILFALRDGTYTFDAPKAPEANLFEGPKPRALGILPKIHDSAHRFTTKRPAAEGRPEEEAEIRREKDGKWWARCGGRPYALGVESCGEAEALLVKDIPELVDAAWDAWGTDGAPAPAPRYLPVHRAEHKGRRLTVELVMVEIEGGKGERWVAKCATGTDVEAVSTTPREEAGEAMDDALRMAGFDADKDERPKWTQDVEAPPAAPEKPILTEFPLFDEGAVYAGNDEKLGYYSVGQPSTGKPWGAFLGSERIGVDFPTSAEARAAVEKGLREKHALPEDAPIAWRMEIEPDPAPAAAAPAEPVAPVPAPTS